jgi:transcriptional regulator with XRE-family HTH domain
MGTTVYVLGMSGFGDRLVATRKRLRVSQEALAVSAGMQRSHLSKIENGRITLPSDDVVSRLASALGISPDELSGIGDLLGQMTPDELHAMLEPIAVVIAGGAGVTIRYHGGYRDAVPCPTVIAVERYGRGLRGMS